MSLHDGIDIEDDKDGLIVLRQRHDVMLELMGFILWTGTVLPEHVFHEVCLDKTSYYVLDKYGRAQEAQQEGKANFQAAMAKIPEGDLPFRYVRALTSWLDIPNKMEGMAIAATIEDLNHLESTWQYFNGALGCCRYCL